MGATSWMYFTPYTPAAADALNRLRQETFAQGKYQQPSGGWREQYQKLLDMARNPTIAPSLSGVWGNVGWIEHQMKILGSYESGDMATLTDEERAEVEQVREAVELSQRGTSLHRGMFASLFKKRRPPKTIAGLLRQAGEAGTHSILDIRRVGKKPGHGIACPLAQEELVRAFGTHQPIRQNAEEFAWEFAEALPRWHAVYFVLYGNGLPSEYAFVGCSGD